ncbi:MAG: ARMT1-like domain-containing protein [Lachnospiraceae bacterium]
MKLNFECLNCNMNQVVKVSQVMGYNREKSETIMREVLDYLSKVDYNRCNAEVMNGTWEILCRYAGEDNVYRTLKQHYNQQVLNMEDEIQKMIDTAENPFQIALRVAISGNLIDFAAKSEFNSQILRKNITAIRETKLGIDDSAALHLDLGKAKRLLYLGDNCGEICLDKLFIAHIKQEFPELSIQFAVRGKAILNDVLVEDAHMVGMDQLVEIIDNGDNCPGTVLHRTSPEFKKNYELADLVIAKGLGNYESLSEENKNIYFLFMAKCDTSAERVGVKKRSIVCKKNC